MAVANINGLEIAYDVIGDGPQTWALTPGGRFSKDYGGVRLLEPPWGDREWTERGEKRDARGESLFARWPLLVPQLADFGRQIP